MIHPQIAQIFADKFLNEESRKAGRQKLTAKFFPHSPLSLFGSKKSA
jgi:hypothetical protein